MWLLGVAGLLGLSIILQGPRRALGQFVDIPGHLRLLTAALRRFRRAWRPLAILFGTTVLAWTANQFATFKETSRLDDLVLLKRAKTVGELAFEHGTLAALVPLRDVLDLGDSLLLLAAATAIVFKLSADRWGSSLEELDSSEASPLPAWTTLCWGCTWLYAMYRFAAMIMAQSTGGLPLSLCVYLEAIVVPFLMLVSDGVLLAWLLVELRNVGLGESESVDWRGAIALVPAAATACLLGMPARYIATADYLLLNSLRAQAPPSWLLVFIHGWGLVELQAAALVTAGVAGAAAWSSGSMGAACRGYFGLLRAHGGRVAATVAATSIASGVAAGVAYGLVLAMPAQPWVLAAADSYAHYASLPIGLAALAALVELGGQALPQAGRAVLPAGELG
jgi:hypothetical protein